MFKKQYENEIDFRNDVIENLKIIATYLENIDRNIITTTNNTGEINKSIQDLSSQFYNIQNLLTKIANK